MPPPSAQSVPTTETGRVPRRTVLSGVAVAISCLAGCTGVTASGTPAAERPDFDGWLSNTAAYGGIADLTGRRSVTIDVGGRDGLSFDPAATRIDVGTSVRWHWTGGGSAHNVVAKNRSFESETSAEAGRTFERTFDTAGLVKYLCVPHEYAGMKGVLLVGD